MITRAVILAAGRGERIGDLDTPNCLARVGRLTLLERALRVLVGAGVRQVAVVVGWQAHLVRAALTAWTRESVTSGTEVALSVFDNPAWDGPNGLSVQAARALHHRADSAGDGGSNRSAHAGGGALLLAA